MTKKDGLRWGLATASCLFIPCITQCEEANKSPTNSTAVPNAGTTNVLSEFQIKKGFRIELVAGENLVEAPVAMAFDENGRLFVAEMRPGANRSADTPHQGRIRLLTDKDGDGVFDSSAIYADNLAAPSAIACYGGGIVVAATSEIIYLEDTKGGGMADLRQVLFSGVGITTNDPT